MGYCFLRIWFIPLKGRRVAAMERKILIGIIVLIVLLVVIGICHDYGKEAIFKWFSRTEVETPAKTPEEIEMKKTLEMEKLEKVGSLVDSEEFLGGSSINGVVEEIFGDTLVLVIQRFNEKGEKIFVTVPIAQDAEITSGKKEIVLDKIKPGDKVFILLNQMQVILSGCPLEGVYVDVSVPTADLLLSME